MTITTSSGTWRDLWRRVASWNYFLSSMKKAREFSGIQVLTFLAKPQSADLDATYVSARRSKMGSPIRWLCLTEQLFNSQDWKPLETIVSKIVKEKQKLERLVISKEDLLEMFKGNPYKQHVIRGKVTEPSTTVYCNGPLIDLCRGSHVPDTGRIEH